MAYKNRRRYKRRSSYGNELIFFPVIILVLYLKFGTQNIFSPQLFLSNHVALIITAIALLVILYAFLKLFPLWQRRHKYRTAKMHEIDHMKGGQFEQFLAVYFRDLGYKILPHRGSAGDKGADLILIAPDGRKIVVQAKRYSGKVPFDAIQQVHTARSLYGANAAIIISNTFFTKQARETAHKLNIELWDRHALIENMYAYRSKKKEA